MSTMSLSIAAGVFTVVGLALIFCGWRGRRVNDHPVCRVCGYDLSGVSGTSQCPECGRALSLRRAIRMGVRQRRTRLALSGAFVILMAGALAWSPLHQARKITNMPIWYLKWQSHNAMTAIPAINEMRRRLNLARLSDAQVRDIVGSALALQADAKLTWLNEWGDLVEEAWARQQIPHETMEKYLRQATIEGFTFVHRKRVRQGTNITLRVNAPACRTGVMVIGNEYVLSWIPEWFDLGGKHSKNRWMAVYHRMMFHVPWQMLGSGPHIVADLPPGIYPLKTRVRVGVTETTNPQAQQAMRSNTGWPAGAFTEWEVDLASEIEIVSSGTTLIEVVDNADMLEQLRQGIRIHKGAITIRRNLGQLHIDGDLVLPTVPMDLAWRCWIEIGDSRWEVSQQSFAPGQSMPMMVLYAASQKKFENFPGDAKECRLIIRPDVTVAEESLDIGERILGGEIIIDHVPLQQEPEQP